MGEPFVLLDDAAGRHRLFTSLRRVHEVTNPADLPSRAGVLLIDYEGRSRLLEFDHCADVGEDEIASLLGDGTASLTPPTPSVTRDEFLANVEAVKDHIRAGDTYQVNLSFRLTTHATGDPRALYRTLRQRQPVGFGALVQLGREWVLSRSPELFVQRIGDELTTRPMKGTAPRGATPHEDAVLRARLIADPKTRAENLMIVDLLRNDLGRVAEIGSVTTRSLFDAEAYPTLWQLTSTITATAKPGIGLGETLEAMFPCGSITGAPKASTRRIIEALETTPRGLYTGAIGWVDDSGDFCLSVAIRTLVLQPRGTGYVGTFGVGAGIVLDSDPAAEWDECLLKAALLTNPRT